MGHIYSRLKELRNQNGLTQKEVAAILNVDPYLYGKYERGERNIPILLMAELADRYQTSMDFILELTDDPKPHPPKRGR